MRELRLNKLGPIVVIAIAVLAAYSGVFSFAFVYDDEFLIQKNRFLDSFEFLGQIFTTSSTAGAGFTDSFYRPIQGFVYLCVQQLFGREPWAFHSLNLALHLMNAILIFGIGRKMRLSVAAATGAALLWGVHPIHTEAVTYMSATADTLHTLFILLGLIVVLPDFRWKRILLSCAFFILALMSKESSIVFPALLVTMIFFFAERRWSLRPYLKTLPAWGIAFLYLIVRKTLLNFNGDFDMYKTSNIYTENILVRIQTYLATIPNYLGLLAWPHDLHIDRQFSVFTTWAALPVMLGILLVLLAIFLIVRSTKSTGKSTWPSWIALWFFASQATQSGILVPVNSLFLEHWMYVPSISLFLGLAACADYLLAQKASWRFVLGIMTATGTVALASATYIQNRHWESPVTLYSRILSYNPDADRVRHNLAMAYSDQGNDDQALKEYETVLARTSMYPQTFHNVARIYLNRGQLDLAEQYELKAIEQNPRFFPSYATLAEIANAKGDRQKADQYRQKFLDLTK